MALHPYDEILERVSRPSRYVGAEYRPRRGPTPRPDALEFVLAFPDVYEIGMSHQGSAVILELLERDPEIVVDRVFAPWPDMEAELRAHKLPLIALDSHLPLSEADVVGFSLLHELSYTNVLTILSLGGIALRATERAEREPIVLGGGSATLHGEPLAPFFDLFLLGEAEETLPALLHEIGALRRAGARRTALLRQIAAHHPSVYVPREVSREPVGHAGRLVPVGPRPAPPCATETALFWPVRRAVADLERHPPVTDGPLPTAEAVFDRVSVEIARGCRQGCRFCQAGMIYRPARERSPQAVLGAALSGLLAGGQEEASLSSLSTADYSALEDLLPRLMDTLAPRRVSLSVSSLRAYGLSDGVLDQIARVRRTGLTLAPEAGSERLRAVINKDVTDEQLIEAVRRAAARGWRRVKLYFMIGLPTEEDDDLAAIVSLAERVRAGHGGRGRPLDVTVAVSNHVPKPHSPFQWEQMDSREELARKQRFLKDRAYRSRVRLRFHSPEMSWLEGCLGRGDYTLAAVIERAWLAGARFDGWEDQFDYSIWRQAFAGTGVDPERFLEALPPDSRLPWDYADTGVERRFLEAERRRAHEAQKTPACERTSEPCGDERPPRTCRKCGMACATSATPRDEGPQAAEYEELLARAAAIPSAPGAGEELVRLRFLYQKYGTARLLGHLELVRHVVRTLRRAGVRVAYSKGFNPHPRVVFPAPLPVGASGLGELLDVSAAADERDPDKLLRDIQAQSPPGLDWLAVEVLPPDSPKVGRTVQLTDHVVALERGPAAAALGCPPEEVEQELSQRAADLMAGDELRTVTIVRRGSEIQVDARAQIVTLGDLALIERHRARVARDLDASDGDWALLGLTTMIKTEGRPVRPREFLGALLPGYEGRTRVYRTGFGP